MRRDVARWLAGLALVAIAAVGEGGCGAASGTPTASPTDLALYEPTGPGGDDALLSGVLTRIDGCVVVQADDLGTAWVPVLPVGTRWEGDELVVGRQRYREGERVEWRGGELAGQDASWLAQVPAGCDGRDMWIVHT